MEDIKTEIRLNESELIISSTSNAGYPSDATEGIPDTIISTHVDAHPEPRRSNILAAYTIENSDNYFGNSYELLENEITEIARARRTSLDSLHAIAHDVSESKIPFVATKVNQAVAANLHRNVRNLNELSKGEASVSSEPDVIADDKSNYSSEFSSKAESPVIENRDNDCYIVGSVHSLKQNGINKNPKTSIDIIDLTEDILGEAELPNPLGDKLTKDAKVSFLLEVLPDVDINYLIKKVDELKTDDEFRHFVCTVVQQKSYNFLRSSGDKESESDRQNYAKDFPVNDLTGNNLSGYVSPALFLPQVLENGGFITESHSNQSIVNTGNPVTPQFQPHIAPPIIEPQIPLHSTGLQTVASQVNSILPDFRYLHQWLTNGFPSENVSYAGQRTIGSDKPHTVTSQETSFKQISRAETGTTSESVTGGYFPVLATNSVLETWNNVAIHNSSLIPFLHRDTLTHNNGNLNYVRERETKIHNLTLPLIRPDPIRPQSNGDRSFANAPERNYFLGRNSIIEDAHVQNPYERPLDQRLQRLGKYGGLRNETAQWDNATGVYNEVPLHQEPVGFQGFRPYLHNILLHRENERRIRRRNILPRGQAIAHELDAIDEFALVPNPGNTQTVVSDTVEDPRYTVIAEILFLANPKFLKKEVRKLKNDDDLDKFLITAIANQDMWNKNVSHDGTPALIEGAPGMFVGLGDNKLKILTALLPDAHSAFLKRESVKLKTDEELLEFALKLSREQTYPKRKNSDLQSNNGKRKLNAMGESDTDDLKYKTLLDMLPEADPDFLLQESKSLASDEELQKFVLKAVEGNSYPKRDEFLKRQEFHKEWKKYIENFDMKEYLRLIPNPVRHFYIEKTRSKNPLNLPVKFLQLRYGHKSEAFSYFYKFKKQNLTKTCDHLDVHFRGKAKKLSVWDQKTIFSISDLQEMAFIQNKNEIAHCLRFNDKRKCEAYEKAKNEGTLLECSCCYEDKLPEDMANCCEGHVFCLNCIKRGSEVVIGEGRTSFPCYHDGCTGEFTLQILEKVLSTEVLSRLLRRKQYAEVNAAGIPGLETCCFCEFCTIPPTEDKLFHCLNPSCMKVTCRSCKKLDHLPFSCEEFARKDVERTMQSYVEDQMTKALIRTCWQCGTKFVKEVGCNMMSCKCGAQMCYFCRQPVKDYGHFASGKCGKIVDTSAHDIACVKKVGERAKLAVENANPGFKLPNDPTKNLMLEERPKKIRRH